MAQSLKARRKIRDLLKYGARFLPNPVYWRLSPYVVGTAAGRVTQKTARYYFGIWLKHYYCLVRYGFNPDIVSVAEIGPGDSLGLGICCLLAGASSYFAFDLAEYTNPSKNLRIFNDLVKLFQENAHVDLDLDWAESTYPVRVRPSDVISTGKLKDLLRADRLTEIQRSIESAEKFGRIQISYIAPWNDISRLPPGSIDLILSNAVLEHLDDLEFAYDAFRVWLPAGGWMSHEIDFRCHGTANRWNGHWTYTTDQWKQIRRNRAYLLNREPYSKHQSLIKNHGFEIVHQILYRDYSGVSRTRLAEEFKQMSDLDLTTSLVLVQAKKIHG